MANGLLQQKLTNIDNKNSPHTRMISEVKKQLSSIQPLNINMTKVGHEEEIFFRNAGINSDERKK